MEHVYIFNDDDLKRLLEKINYKIADYKTNQAVKDCLLNFLEKYRDQ